MPYQSAGLRPLADIGGGFLDLFLYQLFIGVQFPFIFPENGALLSQCFGDDLLQVGVFQTASMGFVHQGVVGFEFTTSLQQFEQVGYTSAHFASRGIARVGHGAFDLLAQNGVFSEHIDIVLLTGALAHLLRGVGGGFYAGRLGVERLRQHEVFFSHLVVEALRNIASEFGTGALAKEALEPLKRGVASSATFE